MGRLSNKEKFINSVFYAIEHSEDPDIKDLYIILLKEKLDADNKDLKRLMYDSIRSSAAMLYEIITKLNMQDDDHSFVLSEIQAVLDQKYWTMYKDTILKETLL